MKKRKLFTLGCLTLGLSFATFGFAKMDNNAQIAKADGASGVVKVYLGPNWSSADCNISVYFYVNENVNGWGSYVAAPAGTFEVDISYNFEWTPTNMIAVRYNSSYSAETWSGDQWGDKHGDSKWNQAPASGGYALSDHIAITSWDTGDVNYPYVASSAVEYGNKMNLEGMKLNKQSHLEYYSDSVTFADNEEFKIVLNNDWCNGYSLSDFVTGKFSRENDGANIKCLEAGTYSLYFDSVSKSVHITDPVLAEADQWAQDFLSSGCSASKSTWGTAASDYAALSPEAKALLADEEHIANEPVAEGFIKQAVQRYDYVLQRFGVNNANTDEAGYQDFMGRISAGKLSLAPNRAPVFEEVLGENTGTIAITLLALTGFAAGSLFFLLKKRKVN